MLNGAHDRGDAAAPPPAPSVAAPSHAERARTLVHDLATGTLCTLAREPAGYPYGSLVTYALDAGDPVFLVSELAEHTKNLRHDTRASLLVAASGGADPLANARVTLLGLCTPVEASQRERVSAAYLSRHPGATGYVGFADFAFWKLAVRGVRFIGGYGRMSWIDPEAWRGAEPDPIAPDAAAILEHMNQDHADALPAYCRAFAGMAEITSARMTHIDRLGFEMSVTTSAGSQSIRLAFHEPIASKSDARKALVGLLKEARAKLAGAAPA